MKHKSFGVVFLLVILIYLTSCSSPLESPSTKNEENEEITSSEVTESKIDPINVTVSLDENNTNTAMIGPGGGTISTIGQDGTTYTLVIPPGALLKAEEISLTPVTEMEGLPLSGGLVGAVDFSPSGLELSSPAILTIQASNPIEAVDLETVGLAYQGAGEQLHLYPMQLLDSATISMQVYHFSGHGSGQGTTSETNNMRQNHSPNDPGGQMNNEAPNPGVSTKEQGINFLNLRWFITVEPILKAAMNDESRLNEAFRIFEWWLEYMDLYMVRDTYNNIEPNLINQGYSMLAAGVENAVTKAYRRCVDFNTPSEVVDIFHWTAFAEREPGIMVWLDINNLEQLAQKCATFELEFTSEVRVDTNIFYKLSTGKIKLEPIFLEALVPGTPTEPLLTFQNLNAQLNWEEAYHISEEGSCTAGIVELTHSTFTIETLQFNLSSPSGYETIEFLYNPGTPVEGWLIDCGIGDPIEFELYQWLEIFCEMRWSHNELEPAPLDCFSEGSPIEVHAIVDTWDIYGSGEVFAERLYTRPLGGFSEITQITLRHTPR